MANDNQNGKTAITRILAFSAPSLPLAAFALPLVIYLPPYYVKYVGLSLGVVGLIFMAARLFDIVIDIFIGMSMDRTSTKIGRFTPWLLACAPFMSVLTWYLFMVKPGVSAWYLVFFLFTGYVAFSASTLAQLGIGASLSTNYHERSRVFSFWQIGNIVGMLMVLSLPVIVVARGGSEADGVRAMGMFIVIAVPLCALVSHFFAKEPIASPVKSHSQPKDFLALFSLVSLRRLMISDIALAFSGGVTGAMFLFYLSSIKDYGKSAFLLLLIYFVSGLVFTPLWVTIAKKFGKHRALLLACCYTILSQLLILYLPKGNVALAGVLIGIVGISYAAPLYLIRSMVSDIGDEDKLVTKKDRTGLLFALLGFTTKTGYALAVGVTFVLLQAIGYDANLGMANTQSSINGLTMIYFGFPLICQGIAIWLMNSYPLTRERVEEVQHQLSLQENDAQ
ncbi:MAG: major facilitator superfamily protein [Hyphomonadaceae bacterium]|nr:MAG: major facilitator superfamily protein [Hyphomonadaceae bacterium]